MTILEGIYNGKIIPSEQFVKEGGEYDRLMEQYSEQVKRLTELLDSEGRELLEEMQEAGMAMERISDKENFIEGFCLGARTMLEILNRDLTDRTVL